MMTTMCICNRTLYSHNQCDNDGQGWCRNKIKVETTTEYQIQQPDTVWHTDEQGNIYHIPIKEEDNNGTGE